jgi:xylose isomerase
MTPALYEIFRGGGLKSGGFNFDAKLRRQSVDPVDLFHAHIGGMDTIARALLQTEKLIAGDALAGFVRERYSGWRRQLGTQILSGKSSLADLFDLVGNGAIDPKPVSGRQEMLENRVARALDRR